MSGSLDRQFILGVMMNHLWDARIGLTELAQYVLVILAHNFHMHKSLGATQGERIVLKKKDLGCWR